MDLEEAPAQGLSDASCEGGKGEARLAAAR